MNQKNHVLAGRARAGDLVFKALLVLLFLWGLIQWPVVIWRAHRVFDFPALWGVLIGILLIVSSWPLLIGFWMRCDWARRLWLWISVLGLLPSRVFNYWAFGPFSAKNSWPALLGSFVGVALVVWICRSRWFSRYMYRPGGTVWFRVGLGVWFAVVAGFFVLAGSRSGLGAKSTAQRVELLQFSSGESLPENWREAEVFGYIIPVPVGSTNNCHVHDDGMVSHVFKFNAETNVVRLTWISARGPSYKLLPELYGIDSLEKYFLSLYENRFTLFYNTTRFRSLDGVSRVGFASRDGFDVMVQISDVGSMSYAIVQLADEVAHYQLIFGERSLCRMEDRLRMVSRIRKAKSTSFPIKRVDP